MTISDTLKRRFIKDYSLPIVLVDEPYFSYFIDLYDDMFQTKAKMKTFTDFVAKYQHEAGFFNETHRVLMAAKDSIMSKDAYAEIHNLKLNTPSVNVEKQSLYIHPNAGKSFLSLDLKKSNFQCMKAIDPTLVDNKDTYEDFLKQFTDDAYIFESKQIRQIMFGKLNPKKMMQKQKEIIAKMILELQKNGVDAKSFLSYSADEIILINDEELNLDAVLATVNSSEYIYHVEEFELNLIHEDRSFFVKNMKDGSVVFKNTPIPVFAEIYKYYNKLDLDHRLDLAYRFEGRMAHFDTPLLF